MQYKIYKNVNAYFIFENIYSHVNKYWTNEVINKEEYTKIWLTIIVVTKKNKKYKLINCLPFNTNNIRNLLIVIKQNLNKISLYNRKDIWENITIKHRLDKNTILHLNLLFLRFLKRDYWAIPILIQKLNWLIAFLIQITLC